MPSFLSQRAIDETQGLMYGTMIFLSSFDVDGNKPYWMLAFAGIIPLYCKEDDHEIWRIIELGGMFAIPMVYCFAPMMGWKGVNIDAIIMVLLLLYNFSKRIEEFFGHVSRFKDGTKRDRTA